MIFKDLTKNFYINSFIIFSIFIIDRISKIYVISLDSKNYSTDLFSSKFLNINLIWNDGIAFGLLSFDQSNLYNCSYIHYSFNYYNCYFLYDC